MAGAVPKSSPGSRSSRTKIDRIALWWDSLIHGLCGSGLSASPARQVAAVSNLPDRAASRNTNQSGELFEWTAPNGARRSEYVERQKRALLEDDREDREQELALRYAIDRINNNNAILPASRLRLLTQRLPPGHSFHAFKTEMSVGNAVAVAGKRHGRKR
ncbi:hypothetical protein HPB52_009752 [Rhipicephalus sanguineus]|uniref:Uncharacterized protein n=1 Tax=Rhipicephalus sanguineus TaxID=34632 RepID=A0A9D4PLS7_RHISA|nr:hypothetical protein HPB52_009752 [Rhipicephalus sanguineus]